MASLKFTKTQIANLALGFSLTATTAQAATYYPIICRGNTSVATEKNVTFAPTKPGSPLTVDVFVLVHGLNRNQEAATGHGENLAPGTCAWLDRPMRPSEPTLIQAHLNDMSQATGISVAISNYSSSTADVTSVRADPFEALRTSNDTVEVYVENQGGSQLDVAPDKPITVYKIK